MQSRTAAARRRKGRLRCTRPTAGASRARRCRTAWASSTRSSSFSGSTRTATTFARTSAGCDCKCRELSFDADYRYCEYCGHTPLQHYSLFNRDIVNPIRKFGYVGAGRKGFVALKRGVLDRVLLRRTKAGRADEMVLPPKVVTIEANFLDAKESDFYQAIYTQSMAQFGSYVQAGTLLNNYAHVLDLLTRLRQAINHPYLVLHSKARRGG